MRVLVTGGNGRIGREAVAAFAAAGHEVLSLDRALPPERITRVSHRIGDVTQMGEIADLTFGFKPQAVVHMAAWVDAGIAADHRTFGDNATGTFNVAHAAARCGAARVILGSSAQVYGFAAHDPVSVPVDEDHPLRPVNAYALSKIAGEATGRYITSQTDTAVLAFRIMGARPAATMPAELARLRAEPAGGRFLLWTRVDVRDVARACRLAAEADSVAPGAYNISGADIILPGTTTRELLARYCPGLDLSSVPAGRASPLSCAKAATAFGYVPRHRIDDEGVVAASGGTSGELDG